MRKLNETKRSRQEIIRTKKKKQKCRLCDNDGNEREREREGKWRKLINYEARAAHGGPRKKQRPGLTLELENHKEKKVPKVRPSLLRYRNITNCSSLVK